MLSVVAASDTDAIASFSGAIASVSVAVSVSGAIASVSVAMLFKEVQN